MTKTFDLSASPMGRPDVAVSGTGVGLRPVHISEVLRNRPTVPWFEILTDNHVARGGLIPRQLEAVRADYPLTLHCVGMSLGGVDALDWDYLKGVKRLQDRYEVAWTSDHLCFTRYAGHHYHDLLPLPYTEEALAHMIPRINAVQDYLGKTILIENASSYLQYQQSTISEAQFLGALVAATGCRLLLDVNNAYVCEVNHGHAATDFMNDLPLEAVTEVHLAGYEDKGGYLLDAHNHLVSDPVWDLYAWLLEKLPEVPTLIEWDNEIPAFNILMEEAARAEALRARTSDGQAARAGLGG